MVTAESVFPGTTTPDYADLNVAALDSAFAGHEVTESVGVSLGNTDGVMSTHDLPASAFDVSFRGRGIFISVVTVEGLVGWAVTCTVSIGSLGTAADTDLCRTILRTFRLIG